MMTFEWERARMYWGELLIVYKTRNDLLLSAIDAFKSVKWQSTITIQTRKVTLLSTTLYLSPYLIGKSTNIDIRCSAALGTLISMCGSTPGVRFPRILSSSTLAFE